MRWIHTVAVCDARKAPVETGRRRVTVGAQYACRSGGFQDQPRDRTMTPETDGNNLRATILHIGATLGRQYIATLLQVLMVLIVARSLGTEALGTYTIALLVPTLLSQFLNCGLASANVYFIASGRVAVRDAWAASRWCVIAIAILGTLVGACVISTCGDRLFAGVPPMILVFALMAFPLMLTTSVVLSFFQALHDFHAYNRTLLIQPGVAVVGAMAIALAGRTSLEAILCVVFASHVAAAVYALVVVSRHVGHTGCGARPLEYLRDVLVFGGKTHAGNLLMLLTYRLDILLVNVFGGSAMAGLYAVAVRLAESLGAISQASSTVLFPTLAGMASRPKARRQVTRVMAYAVVIVTIIASLLIAMVARPVIVFVFGEAFAAAVPPFLILLPGVAALAGARVLANDSAARGRPGLNLLLAGLGLVLNTLANIALIPRYGISGAAMASTLAYSFDLAIRIYLLRASDGLPDAEAATMRVTESPSAPATGE